MVTASGAIERRCYPSTDELPVHAEGWWYDPDSRHTDVETSRGWLQRAAQRWDSDGLSYWTVRLRDGGDVIGVGGAQRQGRGYATELGHAAMRAAAFVDEPAPFIAWVAERNAPSRRVAEPLGLVDRGVRIDASDGSPRLAYADRALDDQLVPPLRA